MVENKCLTDIDSKDTESDVFPKEWNLVKFGDKGHFQYGYTTSALDNNTGIKFLRITDIKEDGSISWETIPFGLIDKKNLSKFKLNIGDILFARIGATTGKTCIINENINCNAIFASYLIRFIPNKELDSKYIFFYTQSKRYIKYVNFAKEGKLKKGLSATELKKFNFPLPPIPEQKKIAAVLSIVQEAKEKTEAVIEAAKKLKKSLMKYLFTYGPVSIEEAEDVPLKKTEIGLIPEIWEIFPLKNIAENFLGGGTPSTNNPEYWNGTIHWTTSRRINGIFLFDGEKKITEKGIRQSSTHLIPKDNLIIGTRVGVGKVAINKIDIAISQDLTAAFINKKKYSLKFLAYEILTDEVQNIFKECTRGTTIKGIPRDDLIKIFLKIPPFPIQQKIANILFAIDKKIEAEENNKKALEELFKTLLHNLMTGKIRVNNLEIPV